MTRANIAVVIIRNRSALTDTAPGEGQTKSKQCWKRLIEGCPEIKLVQEEVEKQGVEGAKIPKGEVLIKLHKKRTAIMIFKTRVLLM